MNTMIHDKQEVSFHFMLPYRVDMYVHFPEVSMQVYMLWQHKYNIFTFLSSKQLNDKAFQHLSF
jgi:hypothetical protein